MEGLPQATPKEGKDGQPPSYELSQLWGSAPELTGVDFLVDPEEPTFAALLETQALRDYALFVYFFEKNTVEEWCPDTPNSGGVDGCLSLGQIVLGYLYHHTDLFEGDLIGEHGWSTTFSVTSRQHRLRGLRFLISGQIPETGSIYLDW